MNVVIVKHDRSEKHYLFIVPDNKKLSAGDLVLCDTQNGSQIGFCVSDSFTTPKNANAAMKLYQAFGLNDVPSASVIERFTLEDWSKSDNTQMQICAQDCKHYSPTQVENAGYVI